MRRNRKTLNIVLASVFAAIIASLTYFVKIPIPGGNGYIHLGDTLIYICACVLPTPLAMLAAGIGGAISDWLGGFAIYIIPTVIIKALLVPCFSHKSRKFICKKNIVALFVAAAITVIGYFAADAVIMYISAGQIKSALLASLANAPWNLVQAVCSAIVYMIFATSLDRLQIKKKLFGGSK